MVGIASDSSSCCPELGRVKDDNNQKINRTVTIYCRGVFIVPGLYNEYLAYGHMESLLFLLIFILFSSHHHKMWNVYFCSALRSSLLCGDY